MRKIFFLVAMVVFTLAVADDFDPVRYEQNKAALAPQHSGTKTLLVHNDYIAVQLEDNESSGNYGRYNIGTWPAGSTLTYAYPSSPWSSWVIVRVDGESYVSPGGGPHTTVGRLVANPSAHFSTYTWPSDPDSGYIYGGWYVPDHPDILVYQMLQPVYLVYPDDTTGTIFIKYRVINNDTECHNIGLLLQLDTMIGANDAAELSTILGYSGIEQDFWDCDTCEFPCYWFAYRDPAGPAGPPDQLTAMGILCGYDATTPDRFAVGGWGNFYNVEWDVTLSGTDYWDSAVLLWWYPVEICPGETLEVSTYYGLGQPVGGELVVQIPEYPAVENCWYDPDTFEIITSFTNGMGTVLHDCVATIDLPDGLSLAPGYDPTRSLSPSDLSSGNTGNTGWHIVINSAPAESESICVYVTSPSYDTVFIKCIPFSLPEVHQPFAEIEMPTAMAVSACPEQQIQLNVDFPNGYDDLQFLVDDDTIDLSNPALELVDDTLLVYTPSSPWDNGEHTFGLLHMDDEIGCSLDSVLSIFTVDVSPPVVSDENPPDSTILGTTDFGDITVHINDNERNVDPASIVFAVNGDTFTVDDSILDYNDGMLTFAPSAAGISFSDGDTIRCSVVDAADDSVDYCEPNHITEPYDWCFNINIVDLWLPDTFGHAGEIVDIPVYIEDVSRFGITSLDVTVGYFPSVLTPVDIIETGTLTNSWGDLDMSVSPSGLVEVAGSGPSLGEGDILFYIRFLVGEHMGTYSRLFFDNATFNDGSLSSNTVDGFFTVLWDSVEWSGTIYFFAKNMPMTHLTFGASGTATNGYDSAIDLIHIPPPYSDIDAYFHLDDPVYPSITALDRDFRNSGDTLIVWQGHALYHSSGDTVWVYWNPASLPDGLLLLEYTTPEGDITLDMKSDTVFTFFDSTDITITYYRGTLERRTIDVCSGWNLLSLPALPSGGSLIREIVPNAMTDGYWYNPLYHGYDILMSPAAEKAFWVYVYGDGEVDIAGMSVPTVAIHLYRGWNMVGVPYSPSGYVLTSEMSTVPGGSILSMFGYDACSATPGYLPVGDTLYVGRGYWFYAMNECNLTIGSGLLKAGSCSPDISLDIYANDSKLTIGMDKSASDGIDNMDIPLPPAPPENSVDFPALVSDGQKYIRTVQPDGKFELSAQSGTELRWNSDEIPSGYEFELFDGANEIDMSAVDNWITQNTILKIVATPLPEKIALLPNKPNPFNTSTEISFVLPEGQNATVELYDIEGKKIRTLYNGFAGSGLNKIVWDGTGSDNRVVPSGIYFVRLKTETKILTRRITLIK